VWVSSIVVVGQSMSAHGCWEAAWASTCTIVRLAEAARSRDGVWLYRLRPVAAWSTSRAFRPSSTAHLSGSRLSICGLECSGACCLERAKAAALSRPHNSRVCFTGLLHPDARREKGEK
jgi:hypothetical protein